jgi:hypothetical protein
VAIGPEVSDALDSMPARDVERLIAQAQRRRGEVLRLRDRQRSPTARPGHSKNGGLQVADRRPWRFPGRRRAALSSMGYLAKSATFSAVTRVTGM